MIIARPSVAEERWLLLADRYPALRKAIEAMQQGGGWKTSTVLGRCLGFLLGLIAATMLGGVLSQLPSPLLVGGLLLVVAAEWLVAQRRIYRSGMEEALYLCGTVAVVVQLLIWSDGNNFALGAGLVATAVLITGWRLLNPVFTTLAAMGYTLAIAFIEGSLFGGSMKTLEAGIASAVIAVIALLLGGRRWQRPSHDRMLDGLVVVMPWLAHGWLTAYGWRGSSTVAVMALMLACGFFVSNVLAGGKRRTHAPLIGAMGNAVCAAYALHQLLSWPMHWRLIICGAVMLAAAIMLERLLRGRTAGITSQAIDEPAGLDLVQLAGVASITPAAGAAPQPGMHGEGGGFGGGGATGRF